MSGCDAAAPRQGEAASDGMLSMVGTPIGNLEDASPRVLQTLRRADLLLCEDTRVTSKLLAHFGIRVPLQRCDENVIADRAEAILDRVAAGDRVAFVSDAGMPGVSDPGQHLVDGALDRGLPTEVIPGPSAVTCALVASGLPMSNFFFQGFLPRKASAQRERLSALARIPGALVIYESPHRVAGTLAVIAECLPARRVALVRELTKLHEEVVRDVAPELARRVAERAQVRGECVLVIEGPSAEELASADAAGSAPSLDQAIAGGLASGEPKASLAKRLAKQYHQPRSQVYDRVLQLAAGTEE